MKTNTDEVSVATDCSSVFVVERCGIAQSRALKYTAVFKRGKLKLSTKFRVWPFAGDDAYIELDPSEWRAKFRVVEEFKTNHEQRPI